MSVEIPKRGSRGANVPNLPGPLEAAGLWLFELVQKRRGTPLGYLTTIGAKSGEPRRLPLRSFTDGPDRWLVVASLAGASRNPAWLHNLRAHPDRVTFEVDGQGFPVTAATLSGAERDEVWARITREAPQFAGYEQSTDRVIPVVRLTRTR